MAQDMMGGTQSNDADERFFFVFGAIFGLIGALFLALGIVSAVSSQRLLANGTHVEGDVIRLVGSDTYAPVVRFTAADGRTVEFKGRGSSSPPAYDIGERVKVVYPTGRPGDAVIHGFFSLWGFALIGGGLGALGVVIGMISGIAGLRARRRARELQRGGTWIDTDFTCVERVNEEDGTFFFVKSQWLAPDGRTMHVFESPALRFDPTGFIDPGQRIRVRIDRTDPANYLMPVDFLPREAGR